MPGVTREIAEMKLLIEDISNLLEKLGLPHA